MGASDYIAGRIYPWTGDYTVGVVSPARIEQKRREDTDRICHAYSLTEYSIGGEFLTLDAAVVAGQLSAAERSSRLARSKTLLDLTLPQNPHKGRYGYRGISGHGRRMVRAASVYLEKKLGRRNVGFATVTLPPLDSISRHLVHLYWGEFCRRLFQELKREYFRRGGCEGYFPYVFVTEIQSARLKKYEQAYNHLHIAYHCRTRKSGYYISASRFRAIVGQTIVSIIENKRPSLGIGDSELSPVASADSFRSSVDCQVIKHSCAGYLSKYMSKGSDCIGAVNSDPAWIPPSQWWGVARELGKVILDGISSIDGYVAEQLYYGESGSLADNLIFSYKIYVEAGTWTCHVGTIGKIRRECIGQDGLFNLSHPP